MDKAEKQMINDLEKAFPVPAHVRKEEFLLKLAQEQTQITWTQRLARYGWLVRRTGAAACAAMGLFAGFWLVRDYQKAHQTGEELVESAAAGYPTEQSSHGQPVQTDDPDIDRRQTAPQSTAEALHEGVTTTRFVYAGKAERTTQTTLTMESAQDSRRNETNTEESGRMNRVQSIQEPQTESVRIEADQMTPLTTEPAMEVQPAMTTSEKEGAQNAATVTETGEENAQAPPAVTMTESREQEPIPNLDPTPVQPVNPYLVVPAVTYSIRENIIPTEELTDDALNTVTPDHAQGEVTGYVTHIYYTAIGAEPWTQVDMVLMQDPRHLFHAGTEISLYIMGGYMDMKDYIAWNGSGGMPDLSDAEIMDYSVWQPGAADTVTAGQTYRFLLSLNTGLPVPYEAISVIKV